MNKHHILSVLVENKAGVLARVSSMFARRGFNIYSLAVAPTEDERFSRITVVVDVESTPLEQIVKQLFKLIHVVKITELDPEEAVERELMLMTVRTDPPAGNGGSGSKRSEVIELANIFGGRIVDTSHEALTVAIAGKPRNLDDFEDLMRAFGIIELQRTGRVALPQLDRTARAAAGIRKVS